jgi:hypothetical protein
LGSTKFENGAKEKDQDRLNPGRFSPKSSNKNSLLEEGEVDE